MPQQIRSDSGNTRGRAPTVAAYGARKALAAVASDLVDLDCQATSHDPLSWPGYRAKLDAGGLLFGETESVIAAEGKLGGRRVTLIAFDFDFLGGSMGEASGRRITGAFVHARAKRQPIVSLVASGGARIQEGMRSLMQLQRVAAACALTRQAGIPHISVVRNPTMGGVWVSLASIADVVLAVSNTNVSFAGPRVREDERAGPEFTAEGKHAAGFIDLVAAAEEVPALLSRYVDMLVVASAEPEPCPLPEALGSVDPPSTGWEAVQRARSPERPHAEEYLDRFFSERVQISGDRVGGRDEGMLCGFGRHEGRTVAYAAQTGSHNSAAGFRTVTRLARLADRLRTPILTLIDTPGAQDTAAAEQHGIGTAIGECFAALSEVSVPVTSLVIGEGGSGGALALAGPKPFWVIPDSYFSVIAPEGAAAILYHDINCAPEVAALLHLGPSDLVRLGVTAGVCRT